MHLKYCLFNSLIFFFIWNTKLYSQEQIIIDSLKMELGKPHEDTTRVNILNDVGGYLVKEGEYKEALRYLLSSQELAEEIEYNKGLAVTYNRMGIIYSNLFDHSTARIYYLKALEIEKKRGNGRGIADVVSNIGIVYSNQGNYAEALKCYFIALKLRERLNDMYGVAVSYDLIANIYTNQKTIRRL